jgi:hypothetical protein
MNWFIISVVRIAFIVVHGAYNRNKPARELRRSSANARSPSTASLYAPHLLEPKLPPKNDGWFWGLLLTLIVCFLLWLLFY